MAATGFRRTCGLTRPCGLGADEPHRRMEADYKSALPGLCSRADEPYRRLEAGKDAGAPSGQLNALPQGGELGVAAVIAGFGDQPGGLVDVAAGGVGIGARAGRGVEISAT